jgi:hypothetical protein
VIAAPRELIAIGYARPMRFLVAVAIGISSVMAPGASGSSEEPRGISLSWAPPQLSDPEIITVPDTNGRVVMDRSKDFIVDVGHLRACGGLRLEGGRNVVVIGGRVTIPGVCGSAFDRTAIKLVANRGTVHLEGILIDGPYTHDGIVTLAPEAALQVENIRIDSVQTRNEGHPDCLQTQRGLGGLRVDRFTCTTQLQGFFLSVVEGSQVGLSNIRNTNIIGAPGKHMFFQASPDIPVSLSNVWLHTDEPWASFGFLVYPQRNGLTYAGNYEPRRRSVVSADGKRLWFVGSNIKGSIYKGRPRRGDFVPAGVAGAAYLSPGYKSQTEPE